MEVVPAMKTLAEVVGDPFTRLPPHSIEAEMCLLASMMLDRDVIGLAVQMLTRDAFFQADHQIIWDVLVRLYESNRPIDAVIVREELLRQGLLESVGGTAYLARIIAAVPSAAHGEQYARIVRDKYLLRQLISVSDENLRDAYSPHESVEQVIDRAEKRIFSVAERRVGGSFRTVGELAQAVYSVLEDKGHAGIMTGFLELDDYLNGLHDEQMIIVAARPSMGKTSFAMNIVENVATGLSNDAMLPVGVFSLEMSSQQLAQRMLCSLSGVEGNKVRKGMLSADEYVKMAQVVAQLSKVPIFVDDSSQLTVLELRAKARRLKSMYGIRLLMIDYLQLMDNPGVESRQQQISEISRGIKSIARELKIPIICLSQLNRAAEGREGHRPRMSDLRESGAIEQDADVVMLLHREDYYRQQEPGYQMNNVAEVIIAKQRNGPTGVVQLMFDSRTTRFKNLANQPDDF
ncbi:MAG: replicative DNA helicase [Tepidisphaerales bacterium]